MKAVRLHAIGDLRVDDIAEPGPPGAREVKLKVEMAGICGSDLHNFRTGVWMSRLPSTPGHEFVATVVETGSGVTGLTVGDRVVADSRVPCGRCAACSSGRVYLCSSMGFVGEVNDGGFAPFTVLPEQQLLRLPDQSLPAVVAAMAEPLAVALHAVNRLNAPRDVAVGVVGAGPIGALVTLVLRHAGHPVLLAERNQARLDRVLKITDATPWTLDTPNERGKPRAAIDTTGAAPVLNRLLGALERGGRLAVVGLYHGAVTVEPNLIVEGGLDVVGCAAFDNELATAVDMLPALAPELAALASEPIALDDVPATFNDLIAGSGTIKALIDPEA